MKLTTLSLLFFLMLSINALAQHEETIPYGHPDALKYLQIEGPLPVAEVRAEVAPAYKFEHADHVANGIAMRNRTSGTIHLRGVPTDATVIQSLLYWNFSDMNIEGKDSMPVLFNGNLIQGRKTADNPDPCWGMNGNHSYVADVTGFTNQTGHTNQDYHVTMVFDEATRTDGTNPWSSVASSDKVRTEGATLIVIYKNTQTTGPLYIYDALSNTTFWNNLSLVVPNPSPLTPGGQDLFTMVGADGQLGGGYTTTSTNETTFFNGVQIAGPPVTNSDWDGSDGWPMVQLWDTHTHVVSMTGTSSQIDYNSTGDCLTPVAFVLDDK